NYRHIIDSLVRKPGAFARYRYREALFPSVVFRRAYDRLREARGQHEADLEYVRILSLAAKTMESEVERALVKFLTGATPFVAQDVKILVAPEPGEVPELAAPVVSLDEYDALLGWMAEVAS